MSLPIASAQDIEITGGIAPGTVVGGRFVVERLARRDSLGGILLARDEKTNKPIGLRVLEPALASDAVLAEAIKNEVKTAARAKHRALSGTYGVGTHAGTLFIACEWAQGSPLSELALQRGGQPLSVRGTYNIIAHVCKALGELHAVSLHGALRPNVVMITKSGRVKITDLGLDLALVRTGRASLLAPQDQAFLAPEIRAGYAADHRADIFGIGGLLYVLLTGRSPADAFVPPSQSHPDATPELDQILLRCLAGDPAQRFSSTQEIVNALLPLAASAPDAPAGELGVEVEVDVDIAMSIAPPAPRGAAQPPQPAAVVLTNTAAHDDIGIDVSMSIEPPAPARAAAPAAGRVSPLDMVAAAAPRPPAPQRLTPPGAPPIAPQRVTPPGAPPAPAAAAPVAPAIAVTVDFGDAVAKLTENDAPRWMVNKSGMDHGPFAARELIKHIIEGELAENSTLFNMDTGDRKPLNEWPELQPFLEQYKLRKDEKAHAVALEKSTTIERRGNVAKVMIFAGSIGVALLIGGGYLMSRQAAEKRAAAGNVDLAEMFESGEVKIKGTAGILKHVGRSGGGGKRSGGSSSGSSSGGGFSSYEDAMNQAMEMGDATKGGGERQLTSSDVQGVMDKRLNSLFSCVSEELRRGGRLGTVRIDLAILGSGNVVGASINTGSGAFKGCISGKIRAIQFPSFPAPRMGARYAFDVN
jgi:serine/threonine-protein kinase